ncbi:MAG: HEAT repeat domain-containing protein [Planctomycetota bacterium]
MNAGLQGTFQFLSQTENEAAVDVLLAGLDGPHKTVQQHALRSLLTRPSPRGLQEVFRRLPTLGRWCQSIVSERAERLARAAAPAIETMDEEGCALALNGIVSFRLYDAVPALLAFLKDRSPDANVKQAQQTVLRLTALFYQELSDPKKRSKRNDLENVRRRITFALEEAVGGGHSHGNCDLVEAFVLLVRPQNVTLRRILRDPTARSRPALAEVLSSSPRGGVIRLLLGFLDDPQPPRVVRDVISKREDEKFVEHLLEKTGPRLSRSMATTLGRFDSFAWAKPRHQLFQEFDGAAQFNAVQLLMASSMDRNELFSVLKFLLTEGKPEGRRAAAQRLAEFEGPEADALVVKALGDEDSGVQAAVIPQIRSRQIPGGMSLLIRMVDSPHKEVREALRKALPEFTYQQFLANFESLPEELVPTSGHLVRRIDVDVAAKLAEDMDALSRVRRRRAVLAAGAMGLVPDLEQSIIERLSDDDHMVRHAAAKALAECETIPSWEALRDALLDRSVIVQEAAEQSLTRICQSLQTEAENAVEEMA